MLRARRRGAWARRKTPAPLTRGHQRRQDTRTGKRTRSPRRRRLHSSGATVKPSCGTCSRTGGGSGPAEGTPRGGPGQELRRLCDTGGTATQELQDWLQARGFQGRDLTGEEATTWLGVWQREHLSDTMRSLPKRIAGPDTRLEPLPEAIRGGPPAPCTQGPPQQDHRHPGQRTPPAPGH